MASRDTDVRECESRYNHRDKLGRKGRGYPMMDSVSYEHPSVKRPLYSFAEADRIARVSSNTSRRWLKGYHFWYDEERREMPPITPGRGNQDAVSFVDLVEVAVIGKLRKRKFSLKRIRQINAYCRLYLKEPRPLVTQKFKVAGQDIFLEDDFDVLVAVGREAGMLAWREVLEPFLEDVEYENDLARRWWPLGRDHKVVVDPDYGFGLPVIEGVGVRTEIIAERREAGDSMKEITYDFGVTPDQIEDALLWEKPEDAAA
jgi:uncharacterized protein (DUF433 family)